ncbi:MAG: peptidase [Firmicutes bacterium]|nr:peptidase [Bacillota bacterium]
MELKDKIYVTLKQLVAVPSISGTVGEKHAAEKIYEMIGDMPYFKARSAKYGFEAMDGDPSGRAFVWAMVDGEEESLDTVLLNAHLDVVDIEGYGHLQPVAFDIEECTKRIGELELDEEARLDLESGQWIFGRGTADIKSGIASFIEIIRDLSESRKFKGKVLFLAVPGEESNSEGMISAIPFLLKLQKEEGINFVGAIISECSIPKNDNEDFKRIYMGSVGKIMPMFFCAGKETHASEPFQGLNPVSLVSEISRRLEENTDFCDSVGSQTTPPPVVLRQTDLKRHYSVQTPAYAVSYFNMMTLTKTVTQLTEDLADLAMEAFVKVLMDTEEKRYIFGEISGEDIRYSEIEPCVMTYRSLLAKVRDIDIEFHNRLEGKIGTWKNLNMDSQTIAINIVKETFESYTKKRPMVVISYIPPYYPHMLLDGSSEKGEGLIKAIDDMIKYASDKFGEKIVKEQFFMGISDLSYTGIGDDQDIESLSSNIVGYGSSYDLQLEALSMLDIPAVVFGGEGKDIHKNTERLNKRYSLEVVPELYKKVIFSLLK